MNDKDSVYIIDIMTPYEEFFQVKADNKFIMMSVLKKVIQSENLLVSVNAIEAPMNANDYLEFSIDPDLNFGVEGKI
jgi:hypothetical protein